MKKYHNQNKSFSLSHILHSFQNAFRGLKLLLKYEYNLYIELLLAMFAIFLGFFLSISQNEWVSLIIVIGLVIFSELSNTVVEKIMDFIHDDYHTKVRDIKDLAAGAVLVSSFISIIVACFIFLPKIFIFLS